MKNFVKLNLIALLRVICAILLTVCGYLSEGFGNYLSLVLFLLSYVILCYDVLIGAIKTLYKEKMLGSQMLMLLASLGAILIGKYIEGNLILIIFVIGEIIEKTTKYLSKESIEILSGLQTDRVRLKNGNVIPVKDVQVNEVIEIYSGQRISVDGMVVGGVSSVDTSILTGKRKLKRVKHGSEVLAGFLNKEAPISVIVTRPLQSSIAQRMVTISENSFEKKTRLEKFVQNFARIYTIVAILVSFLVAIVPPIVDIIKPTFGDYGFIYWVYKALGFLLISCSASMLFSVPLAYFSGVRYASKRGILIKGSTSIELLKDTEIIAFDKTGTLTRSELVVTSVDTYGDTLNKLKLLTIVAIVEQESKHPIAKAIMALTEKLNISVPLGANYLETVGSGIECDSMYGHIKAGSKSYIGAPIGTIASVYVSLDGEFVGSIGIGDQVKDNSKKTFENLHKLGIKKKIILSGDKKFKTDKIAKAILAESAYSNLKPSDKVHAIEDIKTNNPKKKIAYCGDGVNDIPSLKCADVGISIGAIDKDEAFEISQVITMDDNLDKVEKSFRIAKKIHKANLFNIVFSLLVKVLVMTLLLVPFFDLKLTYIALVNLVVLLISIVVSLTAGRYKKTVIKKKRETKKNQKGNKNISKK